MSNNGSSGDASWDSNGDSNTYRGSHSGYLRNIFSCPATFESTIVRCCEVIGPLLGPRGIDALICTGVSGLAMGATVANRLKINFVYVRKTLENSHAGCLLEGIPSSKDTRLLFLDDMICSGKTLGRVAHALYEHGQELGLSHEIISVYTYLYHELIQDHELRVYIGREISRKINADKSIPPEAGPIFGLKTPKITAKSAL